MAVRAKRVKYGEKSINNNPYLRLYQTNTNSLSFAFLEPIIYSFSCFFFSIISCNIVGKLYISDSSSGRKQRSVEVVQEWTAWKCEVEQFDKRVLRLASPAS